MRAVPLAVAVLVAGCGTAGPATPPPAPPPSQAVAPAPQPPPDTFDLAAAEEFITREGFTPTPPEGTLTGPLRAIHSMCTGSANGRCQEVFFFDGQRVAGSVHAGMVEIAEQDGSSVVLSFPRYAPGDPGCCPSAGTSIHRITLVGGGIKDDPPIPELPNGQGG
ncbi:LppP/LprE family lipoprotein [Saccharopolyspora shandongensis]|uniref:LppP/LprE family lipoprotein n=1 Tax=Saccharopolyspora shandongensis TaxID=418495 RepID=UPI0034000D77